MWKITASWCNYKWQRPTRLARVHYFTQRNEIKRTKRTGTNWPHAAYLNNRSTDPSIEPHPVESRDDSIPGNRAEDDRTEPLPLLREVIGMDLSKEYGQDHSKHGDQVHLTPILEWKNIAFYVIDNKGRKWAIFDFGFYGTHSKLYLFWYFHFQTQLPSFLETAHCTVFRSLRMTNQAPKWGGKEHIYSHKSIPWVPIIRQGQLKPCGNKDTYDMSSLSGRAHRLWAGQMCKKMIIIKG